MAAVKGHYVISAPGFIAKEVPYTNYLPEFYQNAQYTFYKNASGQYVDGFAQQEMKDALNRIATAVSDGVLDKESVNNSTAGSGEKFKSTKANSETGVYTYWAGTWEYTLENNLAAVGFKNSNLIRLNPIKELGSYVERISPCWAITTHAANPEGIYKYFIETMLDGGDVQTLWTYGAKGVHWDTKAETVTLQGKEDQAVTYNEGQFHMLPVISTPGQLTTKNHIDPLLAIAKFKNDDPGSATVSDVAKQSEDAFINNSHIAEPLPVTETLANDITDINTARSYVIAQVALGYMSLDDGMAYYNKTVGDLTKEVLASLNK
jgi:hypothetical protein